MKPTTNKVRAPPITNESTIGVKVTDFSSGLGVAVFAIRVIVAPGFDVLDVAYCITSNEGSGVALTTTLVAARGVSVATKDGAGSLVGDGVCSGDGISTGVDAGNVAIAGVVSLSSPPEPLGVSEPSGVSDKAVGVGVKVGILARVAF